MVSKYAFKRNLYRCTEGPILDQPIRDAEAGGCTSREFSCDPQSLKAPPEE
jgi:hypothetical protein